MATIEFQFDANALYCPAENGAAMRLLQGAAAETFVRSFDDTTEEYAQGKFRLPDELNVSGTVEFTAAVLAQTAAASKNVRHRLGHIARADGEDFDTAYTNRDSGDKSVDPTQDEISIHTWTESVVNLGWSAGDLVLFRYSRIAPAADNLPGDMYLLHLSIKVPV